MEWARRHSSLEGWLKAASVYNLIVETLSPEKDCKEWSRANHNVGGCFFGAAENIASKNLAEKALNYLNISLIERRFERDPLLFSRTRSVIGRCHALLFSKFSEEGQLPLAISAYTDAAEVWQPDQNVMEWWRDTQRLIAALCVQALITVNEIEVGRLLAEASRLARRLTGRAQIIRIANNDLHINFRIIAKMKNDFSKSSFNYRQIKTMQNFLYINMI